MNVVLHTGIGSDTHHFSCTMENDNLIQLMVILDAQDFFLEIDEVSIDRSIDTGITSLLLVVGLRTCVVFRAAGTHQAAS